MIYTILIVEDDAKIACMLRTAISKYDYNVQVVEDFSRVLECFEESGADLVLLDVNNRIIFIKDGKLAAEIHRGESRQAFFQKIIDTLSFWGGNAGDLSSIRL